MMHFDLYAPDTVAARLEALRLDLDAERTGPSPSSAAGGAAGSAAAGPLPQAEFDEGSVLPVDDLVEPEPVALAMRSVRAALADWERCRPPLSASPSQPRRQVAAAAAAAAAATTTTTTTARMSAAATISLSGGFRGTGTSR